MAFNFEQRYSTHPEDVKAYDTTRIRKEFLIQNLFTVDGQNMVYSHNDRMITIGVLPVNKGVELGNPAEIRSEYFLERRELGAINVGAPGKVSVDGVVYEIGNKEAIYVGRGARSVVFSSDDASNPARFFILSTPAHTTHPTTKITQQMADPLELGSQETANRRTVIKFIVPTVLKTCQLCLGMTILHPGSIWNTMPSHVHDRRMEVYFYFDLAENQRVCHFMGEPSETRHIWMDNFEAVISPAWSIHSGAGTSNYSFLWGMGGENLDYTDMDVLKNSDLR